MAGRNASPELLIGLRHRLRLHVPDRPGVLAGNPQALGAERIKVEDCELQNQSERGGDLTLLVAGRDEAECTAALLEAQPYGVFVAPALAE